MAEDRAAGPNQDPNPAAEGASDTTRRVQVPDKPPEVRTEPKADEGAKGTGAEEPASDQDSLLTAEGEVKEPSARPAWMEQIRPKSDLLQDEMTVAELSKFGKIEELARAYIEARKGQGVDFAGLMASAKEEDGAALRKLLGVPDAPAGYSLKAELPEGVPVDQTLEAAFRAVAHKNGVSQQAAAEIYGLYNKAVSLAYKKMAVDYARTLDQAQKELQGQWGGDYKKNLTIARRGVNLGGEEVKKLLKAAKLENHPTMVRFMYTVGQLVGEDTLEFSETAGTGAQRTPGRFQYPSMQDRSPS